MPINPYEPPKEEDKPPRRGPTQHSQLALLVVGFIIGAVLFALAALLLPAVQVRR